jgi:hypothetical protein
VRRAFLLAFALSSSALTAEGQEPAAPPPPSTQEPAGASLVALDSSAPFQRLDGSLLRAGATVYQLSLARTNLPPIALGVRTVQVTDAAVGGVAGWLIAETRTGSAVPTSDSLWVTRADLTPERWAATVDRTQLGASFTRDSMYVAVQSYRGRSSFATGVPPGTLLTGGMIDAVVSLLPLRVGYRASAFVLLVEPGSPRTLPAELSVEREERVRVGSADVDCWVVTLRAGVMEERRWVSKDAPRVVRAQQVVANGVLSAELLQ